MYTAQRKAKDGASAPTFYWWIDSEMDMSSHFVFDKKKTKVLQGDLSTPNP